ncbi:MAG: MFS transporter, partial [Planctomycetales bacterium]|nr:MFS transporter [Planctomycetales bacterium]
RMSTLKQSMGSVSALMISVAVLLMGNGLLGTLVPVRANMEAFTGIDIGILGSCYFVGFTLGCLTGPAVIARVGHIRTYLAFIAVASIAALIHAIVADTWIWWILRAMTGFSFSVLFIVIESWLNERSDNTTRGAVLSIYMVINLTVLMLGQLLLTLDDPGSFALFSIAAILFSLAALPIAMTSAQSPDPIPLVHPHLIRLYQLSPVGSVGCFAVGLVNGAFWSIGPIFAVDRGMGTQGIAFFMSAIILGGAIGQWPLGRLSDAFDRRFVILTASIGASFSGLALANVTSSDHLAVYGFGFLFGMFALPLYALTVAHANDLTAPKDYVETSSSLLLLLGIGSSIGPTLSSMLDSLTKGNALFIYTAA